MSENDLYRIIFGADYDERVNSLRNDDIKLAHYTSAHVALSIIEKKRFGLVMFKI